MNLNRYTSFKFENGKIAKNRVVVPPMASQTADKDGFVTDRTIEHYGRLSKSGAAIVFVEYSFIHQTGKGEENQLGVQDDGKIAGLKKISSKIQSSGALAGLQIVHVGGKTTFEITGVSLLGASRIQVPVKGWTPEIPKEMTPLQIQELTQWYIDAAHRASKSGFDIIELHAAHGYGLNQWLSPITNQRGDSHGGQIENRANLLIEIVQKLNQEVPNLLLAVRLPAQDHFDGGLTIEEMTWVVSQLENLGVALIDVSSGIGGWRRPEGNSGEGYLVSDASQLKQSLSIPVIGVGGIESGVFIDEILKAGSVDFAAVGRAILKDPAHWHQRNLGSQKCNLEF
ncbi:MAG: NADH:flavin oxidoreductase [Bdellovibrionota bacterium]